MNEFELNIHDTAINSTMALRELCAFHPDDPTLHIQLAEKLEKSGHEIGSIYAARKAYEILSHENNDQAKKLLEKFGDEILADNLRPYVAHNYLPLAKHFGMLGTRKRKVQLKEGEVLFHKDEDADFIYLILEGEITINIKVGGHFRMLNYVHAGAIVGESAMQPNQSRSATALANVDCTLLRFSPTEFATAIASDTELNLNFNKEALIRRHVTALSSAELFARLRIDLRFIIAKRSWAETCTPHEVIKRPNKHMNHVALLIQGSVRIIVETEVGGVYCGRLKTGDLVGAQRFVEDEPSPMAFIAETECTFICMDYAVIEDLVELSSWFKHKLTETNEQFNSQVSRTLTLQKVGR